MARSRSETTRPRFEPGVEVRVRRGVTGTDFPGIPLGGWSGTIEMVEQVEGQIDYEIERDRKALDVMHPVYKKRCERDGLEPERMWLGEADLELDDGTLVPIDNCPTRSEGNIDREEYGWGDDLEGPPLKPWGFLKMVAFCGIAGCLLGATIGSALKTIQGAGLAATIGGIPSAMRGSGETAPTMT